MHNLNKWIWVISTVLAAFVTTANSYTITVDAHAEECFFENVEADTKMGKAKKILDPFTT